YQLTQTSAVYWSNGAWYTRSTSASVTNSSWSGGVASFGVRTQDLATTVDATVNVNVADMRTGLSDAGLSAAHSTGARFGLFLTSDATTPVSTCQVPAN